MKTKLVYVLTSSGKDDRFTAMAVLSLHTFRKRNPNADILVVMDEPTRLALEKCGSSVLEDAQPVVVDIPSEYNVMQRSRYIKTTLRENVKGDFLYIDGDTFVADNLDEIDNTDADIAMAADLNCLDKANEEAMERCRTAGFVDLENQPYFNSGIMFVRDTPMAHELFRKWHEYWKKSLGNGVPQDQPALCEANKVLAHPIKELAGIWNYQYRNVKNNNLGSNIRQAKILHYYTVTNFGNILAFLLDRVRDKGRVDAIAAVIVRWPHLLVYVHHISMFFYRLRKRS